MTEEILPEAQITVDLQQLAEINAALVIGLNAYAEGERFRQIARFNRATGQFFDPELVPKEPTDTALSDLANGFLWVEALRVNVMHGFEERMAARAESLRKGPPHQGDEPEHAA